MGFKTSEWASSFSVVGPKGKPEPTWKAVLLALAIRADDKTRECFPGHDTLAAMTDLSVAAVARGLAGLESVGIITRTKRNGKRGYRTTDLYFIDVTYTATGQPAQQPTTQEAKVATGKRLPILQQAPTLLEAGAIEDHSDDQSLGQSVLLPTATFAEFWIVWPRSDSRKSAEAAWAKAAKRADPLKIVAAASAYANHPHRPAKQFVPYAATWLNGDRWNDPLPDAPGAERRTLTRAEQNLALARQMRDANQPHPKEIAS